MAQREAAEDVDYVLGDTGGSDWWAEDVVADPAWISTGSRRQWYRKTSAITALGAAAAITLIAALLIIRAGAEPGTARLRNPQRLLTAVPHPPTRHRAARGPPGPLSYRPNLLCHLPSHP